jgi:hypothetical protein
MEDAGPLWAVTRGVVPLRLYVTRRLTCCRCLPFLLASQTALTPSANHWASLVFTMLTFPCFMGEPWRARLAASLLRLLIPGL